MDFPYLRILKQAFGLLRTHRFLWIFGLFLFWENIIVFWALFYSGKSETEYTQNQEVIANWFAKNPALPVAVIVAVFILLVYLIWMYLRSKGAMIVAVRDLIEKKHTEYSLSLKEGSKNWKKIGVVTSMVLAALIFCALVLGLPVTYLIIIGFTYRAFILLGTALLIFIPILILLVLFNALTILMIVSFGMTAHDGLRAAWDLIGKYWWILISITLIVFIISIIGCFLSVFAAAVVLVPFVFLGRISYDMGGLNPTVLLKIVGSVISFVVFLGSIGLVTAYQQIVWIIVFNELVRPKKVDEAEEQVVMPEVV